MPTLLFAPETRNSAETTRMIEAARMERGGKFFTTNTGLRKRYP